MLLKTNSDVLFSDKLTEDEKTYGHFIG